MRSRSTSTPTDLAESFLLRRWRVDQENWRCAIQRIPDGVGQGFANAADMLAYLNHGGAQ